MDKTKELGEFLKELSEKTPVEFAEMVRNKLPESTSHVVLLMLVNMMATASHGIPFFLTGILVHAKMMELEEIERQISELERLVNFND